MEKWKTGHWKLIKHCTCLSAVRSIQYSIRKLRAVTVMQLSAIVVFWGVWGAEQKGALVVSLRVSLRVSLWGFRARWVMMAIIVVPK